jgi:hypothetical protein
MRVRTLSEYPGYVITEDGRVYGPRKKWLKASPNSVGYPTISIAGGKDVTVHKLVALAYLGDPPTERHEVAHLNGIKIDNRASNLAWKTHVENEADKLTHGTRVARMPYDSASPLARAMRNGFK